MPIILQKWWGKNRIQWRPTKLLLEKEEKCVFMNKEKIPSRGHGFIEIREDLDGPAYLLLLSLKTHKTPYTNIYINIQRITKENSKVKFFRVAVRLVYLHFNLNHVLVCDPAWCIFRGWYGNAWEHWKWPVEQRGTATWGTTQPSGIWLVKQRGLCSRASAVLSDTTCMHAHIYRRSSNTGTRPLYTLTQNIIMVMNTKPFCVRYSPSCKNDETATSCYIEVQAIDKTKFSWPETTNDMHTERRIRI